MEIFDYEISEELSKGVWVELFVDGEPFSVQLANVNTPKNQSLLEKEKQNWLTKERRTGKKVTDKDWETRGLSDVLPVFLGKHILLDWKGLTSKGKAVPFSIDLAQKLCDPKKFPKHAVVIMEAAANVDVFLNKQVREAVDEAKNI